MLTKAISKGALDEELSDLDKEPFIDVVSSFGALGNGTLQGTRRGGYAVAPEPGLDALGDTLPGLDMGELHRTAAWAATCSSAAERTTSSTVGRATTRSSAATTIGST
ncbi:MAG: hypothetical protein WA957_09420 [Alteraurantiacibacter sp.]